MKRERAEQVVPPTLAGEIRVVEYPYVSLAAQEREELETVLTAGRALCEKAGLLSLFIAGLLPAHDVGLATAIIDDDLADALKTFCETLTAFDERHHPERVEGYMPEILTRKWLARQTKGGQA